MLRTSDRIIVVATSRIGGELPRLSPPRKLGALASAQPRALELVSALLSNPLRPAKRPGARHVGGRFPGCAGLIPQGARGLLPVKTRVTTAVLSRLCRLCDVSAARRCLVARFSRGFHETLFAGTVIMLHSPAFVSSAHRSKYSPGDERWGVIM